MEYNIKSLTRGAFLGLAGLALLALTNGCADISKHKPRVIDGEIVSEPVIVRGSPSYLQFNIRENITGKDKIIQVTYQNDKDEAYMAEKVLAKETRKGDRFKMISPETDRVIIIPYKDLGKYF
jgi:hypothetical protein